MIAIGHSLAHIPSFLHLLSSTIRSPILLPSIQPRLLQTGYAEVTALQWSFNHEVNYHSGKLTVPVFLEVTAFVNHVQFTLSPVDEPHDQG
jgi:hypothetical protein